MEAAEDGRRTKGKTTQQGKGEGEEGEASAARRAAGRLDRSWARL